MTVKLLTEHHLVFLSLRRLHRLVSVYTYQNATLLEITCHCSNDLGPVMRKSVCRVYDHVRLNRACSPTEGSYNIKILNEASLFHTLQRVDNKVADEQACLYLIWPHVTKSCFLVRRTIRFF